MMTSNILNALHKQINEELFSAYAYLAISAKAEALQLPGFASWFRVQAKEEIDHAMGFFNHLAQRGETIELDALAKPELALSDARSLVAAGLHHEKHITGTINNLVKLAKSEDDAALGKLLEWYVEEQQEEEESLGGLVERIDALNNDQQSLLSLDTELGQRQYHPSSILTNTI